jgi:ribonuclease-3
VIPYFLRQLRLLLHARKESYLQLYPILGFYPDKIAYYQLALRHRSSTPHTEKGYMLSNERLEFLGDAVLNSVVTDILFNRYTHQQEGFLTNTRSKVVSRVFLNRMAVSLGLDKLVVTSRHMNRTINRNVYGNALEALLGAIYLDYGYKQCKIFVERQLFSRFVDLDLVATDEQNYKSRIIELCQKYRLHYEFELVEEQVEASNKHLFTTRMLIEGLVLAEASGASKKISQQKVACAAYERLMNDPVFFEQLKTQVR